MPGNLGKTVLTLSSLLIGRSATAFFDVCPRSRFPSSPSICRSMATDESDRKIGALRKAGIDKPADKVSKDEWAKVLTPYQFAILRNAETERAGSGQYLKMSDKGDYHCAACGSLLFDSSSKFESRCGWPSFHSAADVDSNVNVGRRPDFSFGVERVEIFCKKCGGHLGHVFDDGPMPSGERFCVNSVSLEFVPK